ncbi:MAG: hypothetical protein JKX75_06180 [Gammaproteobacteria bacterium]|nr:hypothetical protein [Gammaproteobacteria bacterium]
MVQSSEDEGLLNSTLHGLEFIAPKGRWAIRVELRQNAYDEFYDNSGNKHALGNELNAVDLNQNVLPDLAVFGATASLGVTDFSANVETKRVEFTIGYGITDDLTVGFIVPYGEVKTRAAFSVSGGNIGFNPGFNPALPPGPTNPPLLPVGAGPTEPVGTEGVQAILSDPAFGFAYKPLGNTSWKGIGDPTIGLLWRFYKSADDSLILGTGIRIGLAEDVDADDLLQVPIDDGTTDYRARLEYYRNLGSGFDLKLATEYTYQFEDSVTRRVPSNGALLAPLSSKETLDRKLGDYWEYDIGVGKVMADWRIAATWHRYVKSADRYQSSLGTDTSALQSNTALYANQWRATISWSGIRSWKNGDFPVPLIVQLELQETYKAKNFPDVRDIYLQVTSFF